MIVNWFRNISVVTADDKADFEVMLLDRRHTEDAQSALIGMMLNLGEKGLNLGLLDLLLAAADQRNAWGVRAMALSVLITVMVVYDDAIRQQDDLIDRFLELLSYDHDLAFALICQVGKIRNRMIFIGRPVKQTKETLVYKLIVVGEEANRAFDHSCC